MRFLHVAIPFVIALLLSPTVLAQARTETKTYEASAMAVSITGLADPVGVTKDGTFDIGGVSFDTEATDTQVALSIHDDVKATIDPANQNNVPAEACQDLNGDGQCDVTTGLFCGSTTVVFNPNDPINGFQPGIPIVVFVYTSELKTSTGIVDFNLKGCPGNTLQRAYQGEVTAAFS